MLKLNQLRMKGSTFSKFRRLKDVFRSESVTKRCSVGWGMPRSLATALTLDSSVIALSVLRAFSVMVLLFMDREVSIYEWNVNKLFTDEWDFFISR